MFPVKKVTPAMVMDEMFSLALSDLPLGDTEQVFGFESDISTKSMDSIIPVDLPPLSMEELEFDFEDMEDFGPWIETDVTTSQAVEPEPSKNQLSDRLNLKDLEMSEAVRYDCMWSSYNSFNADKSVSVKSRNPSSSSLNLSNSFYDSLLNSVQQLLFSRKFLTLICRTLPVGISFLATLSLTTFFGKAGIVAGTSACIVL